VGGIHFQHALADFDLMSVPPEHILHEADDELRHAILPAVWTASLTCFRADLAPAFRRDEAPQSRRKLGGPHPRAWNPSIAETHLPVHQSESDFACREWNRRLRRRRRAGSRPRSRRSAQFHG